MLLGDRAEWRELATACIGEENVDLATLLLNSVIETVDIGELAHIALHAAHAAADLFDCGGERFLTAAGDEDRSAFGCEGLAVARPMPLVPPVTTATLLSNLCAFARGGVRRPKAEI